MDMIAHQILREAKSLLAMDAKKRANYDLSYEIVADFKKISGIDGVGVSDGFNDDTNFSVQLELTAVKTDNISKNSPRYVPSEFSIPLRSIGRIVKKQLAGIKMSVVIDGRKATVRPILDSKIYVPIGKAWRDDYGNTHRVYEDSQVSFHVYMKWEYS